MSTPAPNPIPPTGGGPTTDTGSTGSPAGNTPTSTQGPTTDTGAQNGQTGQSMNAFGYEPFQGGTDGGVGPAPIRQPDAGTPSPLPRADGGGIGGIGTSDGGFR